MALQFLDNDKIKLNSNKKVIFGNLKKEYFFTLR